MAPEILASLDRYPSSDIFSLGMTIYEILLLGLGYGPLPEEGQQWHDLREKKWPHFDQIDSSFHSILERTMDPIPNNRISANEILVLRETQSDFEGDATFLNWTRRMPTVALNRSRSFTPVDLTTMDSSRMRTPTNDVASFLWSDSCKCGVPL